MRSRVILGLCVSALVLTGCGSDPAPAATSSSSGSAPAASSEESLLSEFGLAGMDATAIIAKYDPESTPEGLVGSVRATELLLTAGDRQETLPMPADKFYVSVAPYLRHTHECFNHNLTTCQGELAGETFDVTIVDSAGVTLVDEEVTTYANGFVGFWLPRDIEATMTVTSPAGTATGTITTGPDSPTCITTFQLT